MLVAQQRVVGGFAPRSLWLKFCFERSRKEEFGLVLSVAKERLVFQLERLGQVWLRSRRARQAHLAGRRAWCESVPSVFGDNQC